MQEENVAPINDKATSPGLSEKSERIVVDEIFDDGTARLLRAARLPNTAQEKDFAIHTWGEEREDFIEAWRVEAYVGYPSMLIKKAVITKTVSPALGIPMAHLYRLLRIGFAFMLFFVSINTTEYIAGLGSADADKEATR